MLLPPLSEIQMAATGEDLLLSQDAGYVIYCLCTLNKETFLNVATKKRSHFNPLPGARSVFILAVLMQFISRSHRLQAPIVLS